MTYPWGRTLVWHRALVSVEHGEGFVRLCKRAVMHEKCRTLLFPSVLPASLALTLCGFCRSANRYKPGKSPRWWQNVVMAEANGRCWKILLSEIVDFAFKVEQKELFLPFSGDVHNTFAATSAVFLQMFNTTAISFTNEKHIKNGPLPLQVPGSDLNGSPC